MLYYSISELHHYEAIVELKQCGHGKHIYKAGAFKTQSKVGCLLALSLSWFYRLYIFSCTVIYLMIIVNYYACRVWQTTKWEIMSRVLIFSVLISLSVAAPTLEDAQAKILSYENNNDGQGNYEFRWYLQLNFVLIY